MVKCAMCESEMQAVYTGVGSEVMGIKVCRRCRVIHSPGWSSIDSQE